MNMLRVLFSDLLFEGVKEIFCLIFGGTISQTFLPKYQFFE